MSSGGYDDDDRRRGRPAARRSAVTRPYPLAKFDPPQPAAGYGAATWFCSFGCPLCGTTLGRQRLRAVVGFDEDAGYRVTGYLVERVEFRHGIVSTPSLPGGGRAFGLPHRAFRRKAAPAGARRRSVLHRGSLVLPTVGDPYQVGRHDPRRARTGGGEWVLGLTGEEASHPFVVSCVSETCQRRRCLVAGRPSDAELAAATVPSATVLDSETRTEG